MYVAWLPRGGQGGVALGAPPDMSHPALCIKHPSYRYRGAQLRPSTQALNILTHA